MGLQPARCKLRKQRVANGSLSVSQLTNLPPPVPLGVHNGDSHCGFRISRHYTACSPNPQTFSNTLGWPVSSSKQWFRPVSPANLRVMHTLLDNRSADQGLHSPAVTKSTRTCCMRGLKQPLQLYNVPHWAPRPSQSGFRQPARDQETLIKT